jgi:transposase-like protein
MKKEDKKKYICKSCKRIFVAKDYVEAEKLHRMFRDCYDMHLIRYEDYLRELKREKNHLDGRLV